MTTILRIVSENWVKCDDVTVKFYHDSAVASPCWVGPGPIELLTYSLLQRDGEQTGRRGLRIFQG